MAKKANDKSQPSGAKNSASGDADLRDELGEDMKPVERWIEELAIAKEAHKPYWEQVDEIVKKYKDERDDSQKKDSQKERRYNVLWSITQTMQPLVYSQAPQPFVSRKHNDKDPVGRDAGMILQRGLTYELEGDGLHDSMLESRDEYLLASRGVIWGRYQPYMQLRESDEKTYLTDGDSPPEGVKLGKDKKGQFYKKTYEDKVFEEVQWEHVHYRRFLHGASDKWRNVPWVARMVPMTRKELVKRFDKKIAKQIPLTIDTKKSKSKAEDQGDGSKGMFAKAEVWEIWSKADKEIYWVCPNFKDDFLDKQEDFLELDDFFPCPKPAYGTKTNESLIPKPDYLIWQDIAIELDEITWRIKLLVESLRVVGIYDASMGEVVQRLTKQTRDNDLIAVDSWAMFAEKGGLKGAIEFLPIDSVAAVLDKLYMARERLIKELYDITGVSDIVRGASDPRETAKAQQIKGNFANKRLKVRQDEMLRMAREALEIQSQIMCKHYSPETLKMISSADQVLLDPVTQRPSETRFLAACMLLKNSPLRRFRVKIDERTLAMADVNDDRDQRVQFVQGISQLLGAATQMIQVAPAAGPLLGEILMFAVRGFPLAASTEAAIESALEQLMQTPLPSKPEDKPAAGTPPPTPQELAIEQEKNQIARDKVQNDAQAKQRELDIREYEASTKAQVAQAQAANRERESGIREMKASADTQIKAAQVDSQNKQAQAMQNTEMMKFSAEQQRADAEMEHQKTMDYAGAMREDKAQEFDQKNQYRQAFQGGAKRR